MFHDEHTRDVIIVKQLFMQQSPLAMVTFHTRDAIFNFFNELTIYKNLSDKGTENLTILHDSNLLKNER